MRGIVLWGLLLSCVAFASENNFELFHEANQAFDKGEYDSAIGKYNHLISQGIESGELEFNLANSYFKTAKLGQSIYHYRRALELSPRDSDLKFNLNYARAKVADQVENKDSIFQRLWNFSDSISEKEIYYWLTGSVLLLFLIAVLHLYRGREWQRLVRNGLVGFVIVFGGIAFHHSFLRPAYGVVTAGEAKVYSGVGKDNVVLFTLHEGVEFVVAETMDLDWVRIRLSDGKQGWARSENVTYDKNS
jgi:tetratricopeptide (TPR) repeat protein